MEHFAFTPSWNLSNVTSQKQSKSTSFGFSSKKKMVFHRLCSAIGYLVEKQVSSSAPWKETLKTVPWSQ